MKTTINNILFIAGGCCLFIGVLNLIGAMICTLITDDFNPHDEVKTFTLIMWIVGALWLIRRIIGTELEDGWSSDWHDIDD